MHELLTATRKAQAVVITKPEPHDRGVEVTVRFWKLEDAERFAAEVRKDIARLSSVPNES